MIIPNLLPFSKNEVEIAPKGLPMSVELKSTMQRTAPTTGAVVKLQFQTEEGGRAVMIRARQDNGEVIPFGAQVTDSQGKEVGTIAQASRILVRRVVGDAGALTVKWAGATCGSMCRLNFTLPSPAVPAKTLWTTIDSRCSY